MGNLLTTLGILASAAGVTSAYFYFFHKEVLGYRYFIACLFISGTAVSLFAIKGAYRWFNKLFVRRSLIENKASPVLTPLQKRYEQSLIELESIKRFLPNANVEQATVIQHNDILEKLKNDTGFDLTAYCIPLDELRPHETRYPVTRTMAIAGNREDHIVYSKTLYCKRQRFHTAIDTAISRLKSELPNANRS
jgi:hypothetical protein